MSGELFRVYTCRCGYTGIVSVGRKSDETLCAICQTSIHHGPDTKHVTTRDEAVEVVKKRVYIKSLESKRPKRGLGLKRRILGIVVSLYQLSREHPVPHSDIIRECTDAGINIERVPHFLDRLEEEGSIARLTDGRITISGDVK